MFFYPNGSLTIHGTLFTYRVSKCVSTTNSSTITNAKTKTQTLNVVFFVRLLQLLHNNLRIIRRFRISLPSTSLNVSATTEISPITDGGSSARLSKYSSIESTTSSTSLRKLSNCSSDSNRLVTSSLCKAVLVASCNV